MIWPPSLKQTTTTKRLQIFEICRKSVENRFLGRVQKRSKQQEFCSALHHGGKGRVWGGFSCHRDLQDETRSYAYFKHVLQKTPRHEGSMTRECTSLISLKLHISDRSSQTLPAFPAKARKYARQKEKEKRQKNITQKPHRNTNNETSMTCARLSLAATSCHLLNRLLLAEWTWFNPCISCHGFPFSPPPQNYDVRGARMLSNCYKEACRK